MKLNNSPKCIMRKKTNTGGRIKKMSKLLKAYKKLISCYKLSDSLWARKLGP